MGLPGQAIHQLIWEQAGMDEQGHKKQPDALLPGTLTINLPGPLQEALIEISTLLPTVPDKTYASLRSRQRQLSQLSPQMIEDPPPPKAGVHNDFFVSGCGSRETVRSDSSGHPRLMFCQQKKISHSPRNWPKSHLVHKRRLKRTRMEKPSHDGGK